jgi:hypothetical protein
MLRTFRTTRKKLCETPEQDVYCCAVDEENIMDLLMTVGIVLLILWLLGLVTSYTLGGFIHILLVLALIVLLVRIIQGRRPIP